jgi:hypothetical protein
LLSCLSSKDEQKKITAYIVPNVIRASSDQNPIKWLYFKNFADCHPHSTPATADLQCVTNDAFDQPNKEVNRARRLRYPESQMSRLVIALTIVFACASVANSADTKPESTTRHPHPVHATTQRVRHPVNTASRIIHHPVHETSLFIHEATGTASRHSKPE